MSVDKCVSVFVHLPCAVWEHRLKGNPENWWAAVGRVNVFRSSISNNAFSPLSLRGSQKSREPFVFVMEWCLLCLFCKIVTKFGRLGLHLNNVFVLLHHYRRTFGFLSFHHNRDLLNNTTWVMSHSAKQSCRSNVVSWHWGRALRWICAREKNTLRDLKAREACESFDNIA